MCHKTSTHHHSHNTRAAVVLESHTAAGSRCLHCSRADSHALSVIRCETLSGACNGQELYCICIHVQTYTSSHGISGCTPLAGWFAVYSSNGWARYSISVGVQGPLVLAMAVDGQRFRICLDLACPFPSRVRKAKAMHGQHANSTRDTCAGMSHLLTHASMCHNHRSQVSRLTKLAGCLDPLAIWSQ